MIWDDYKNEFDADGGLRDIYVNDTSLKDWQRFVDYLRKTEARLEYFVDNEVQALPAQIDEIFQSREHARLLSIDLGGVSLNCHFFVLDQIELDFDPGDIRSEAQAKVVFRLMSTVARVLDKVVILTYENEDQQPVFKYQPGKGLEYLAPKKYSVS
ncbi:hypothetical protein [Kaarinaea lacus]